MGKNKKKFTLIIHIFDISQFRMKLNKRKRIEIIMKSQPK